MKSAPLSEWHAPPGGRRGLGSTSVAVSVACSVARKNSQFDLIDLANKLK